MTARTGLVLLFLAVAGTSAAEFGFSRTLGDHAVVQNPVTVWGTGEPGTTVTTAVSGGPRTSSQLKGLQAKVGKDGIWRQALPTLAEGIVPYKITSESAGVSIVLGDILVGKTILCSGQSNVELVSVDKAFNATEELAACGRFPYVRLANVENNQTWGGPLVDLAEPLALPWTAPNATSCTGFSATCYFAARELFEQLGGTVPVGVVESAVGGTAVRNWVPTSALARCSQPWEHDALNPYTHSTLYNGMISAFGTGPTTFSFVLWDQAESDSYPQTMPGYYSCQTLAHVQSWRVALQAPSLPWIFVHLQPYDGSEYHPTPLDLTCASLEGDPLAELRHEQLTALYLASTGYATAMDLGDPSSPYGTVHFRNKQPVARRAVSAALSVAFGRTGGSGGALEYPPPEFQRQTPGGPGECSMNISFSSSIGEAFALALGSTPDPFLSNTSSAVCAAASAANCSGFELLCTNAADSSDEGVWLPAEPTLSKDKSMLQLKAASKDPSRVARGSRYAWAAWPLSTLFAETKDGELGLPILPWSQGLSCSGGAKPGAPC